MMSSGDQKSDITESQGLQPGTETMDRPDAAGQKDSTEAKAGIKGKSGDGQDRPAKSVPTFNTQEFDSKYYKKFGKMGKALIINNLSGNTHNKGVLTDKVNKLKGLLQSMGFEAVTRKAWVEEQCRKGLKHVDDMEYQNVSKEDVVALMRDASLDDYGDHHCSLTIILTSGKDGVLEFEHNDYQTHQDVPYPKTEVTTLQEFFKDKTTLNMKPKLFFIQAGERPVERADNLGGLKQEVTVRKIPREADFFTYMYELPYIGGDYEFLFLDVLTQALREFVKDRTDRGEEPLEVNKLTIRMNGMIEDRLSKEHWEFNDSDMRIPCVTTLLTKYMNFNHGEKRNPY